MSALTNSKLILRFRVAMAFFILGLVNPRTSWPNIITGVVACVAIFPLVYCLRLLRRMEKSGG